MTSAFPRLALEIEDTLEQAWLRLGRDLTPEQLRAAFRPPLSASALETLLTTPRIERRLVDRVAARLVITRPTVEDFASPPARIVLAGRTALQTAMRMAGAIRHRAFITPLILKSDRAEVAAGIGADAFAAAQACRAPGPAATVEWTKGEIIAACKRDGPVCMASWLRALPVGVASWIAALMPELIELDVPDYPDPEIVECAILGAAAAIEAGYG